MAIYHFQLKTLSRSEGRTSTAAAAYRSGERITDLRRGQVFDYSKRSGVMLAEVILPDGGTTEREMLWNRVEQAEKRVNSTVAREIVVAVPHELSAGAQKALVLDYAQGLSARTGWGVDVAIHAPGREGDLRNVHAHLLCTTRNVSRDPSGLPVMEQKTREWDIRSSGSELIRFERQEWERCVNQSLEQANALARVDCRSHAERGTGLEPQIHLGVAAMGMERKGIQTQRGEIHRGIEAHNAKLIDLGQVREALAEEKAFDALLVGLPSMSLSKQQVIRDSYQLKRIQQLLEEDTAIYAEQAKLDALQAEKDLLEQTLSHLEEERTDKLYQWQLFNIAHPWMAASHLPVPEMNEIKAGLLKLDAEREEQQQALTGQQMAMQQAEERLTVHREEAMPQARETHFKQVEWWKAIEAIVQPQEQAQDRAQQAAEMARWSTMSIEALQAEAKRYAVWESRQVAFEYPEVQGAHQPLEWHGPWGDWQEKRQTEAVKQADGALSRTNGEIVAWRTAHPFQARMCDFGLAYPAGLYQELLKERIQKERQLAQVQKAWQQFAQGQAKAKETLEKAIQSVMPKVEREAQERQQRHAAIQRILTPRLEMQRQQEIEKQKRDRDHGQGQGWSR